MDSTSYSVILRLSTEGSLDSKLGSVGARADDAAKALGGVDSSTAKLATSFSDLGVKAGDSLSAIADKAIDVGLSIAKWGSAAIAGLATYGVAHLNNELEQTQISLGAIAQAQGFTKTFEQGFQMAGEQVAKMKTDVKTLPGDLGQLSNIMKMIATPAAQGGASMDQIRLLAGKTMLTSTILGVNQDMAAREMAGLLAGHATVHNILGGRLGIIGERAKEFNAESPEKRLKDIEKELNKYQGAADRFAQSYVANWTTLKDNIKYGVIAEATLPLFDRVKHSLAEINTYFDEHKDKIHELTQTVGGKLALAWDSIENSVKRVSAIVGPMLDRLVHMQPAEIGQKLETGARDVLALKLAGMGLSAGSRMLPGLVEMLGGGGSAAAEGAAGGAGVGALGAALGLVTLAAFPLAGVFDNLTNSSRRYHEQDVILAERLAEKSKAVATPLEELGEVARSVADALGHEMLIELNRAADLLLSFGRALSFGTEVVGAFFHNWNSEDARRLSKGWNDVGGPIADHDTMALHLARLAPNEFGRAATDAAKATKIPPIHATVHATVAINVQSNADPSRLARLVKFEFDKHTLYPTASKFVPIYDGLGRSGG